MRSPAAMIMISVALLASGCAVEIDDGAADGDERVGEAEGAWTIGSPALPQTWDSGETASLSVWQGAECHLNDTSFLVTQLKAWREPSMNADNFIARLQARCTEYDLGSGRLEQTSTFVNDLVHTANYRSDSGTTALTGTYDVPLGVRLKIGPGDSYVKDVSLLHGTTHLFVSGGGAYVSGYASPTVAPAALGLGGSDHTLMCPDQHMLSTIAVRYDTRNGKIRTLKISCGPAND